MTRCRLTFIFPRDAGWTSAGENDHAGLAHGAPSGTRPPLRPRTFDRPAPQIIIIHHRPYEYTHFFFSFCLESAVRNIESTSQGFPQSAHARGYLRGVWVGGCTERVMSFGVDVVTPRSPIVRPIVFLFLGPRHDRLSCGGGGWRLFVRRLCGHT